MDAASFQETETLMSGVTVTIRAIRPDDKAAIAEAFGKLERESVYTRFFHAKESLSDQDLKAATEVDFKGVVHVTLSLTGRA